MFLTFIQSFTFEILLLLLLLLLLLQYTGLSTTTVWNALKNNQAILNSIVLIFYLVEIFFILLIIKTYWFGLMQLLNIDIKQSFYWISYTLSILNKLHIVWLNDLLIAINFLFSCVLYIFMDLKNFVELFEISTIYTLFPILSLFYENSFSVSLTLKPLIDIYALIHMFYFYYLCTLIGVFKLAIFFIGINYIQIIASYKILLTFYNFKIILLLVNCSIMPLFNVDLNNFLITADFYNYNLFDLSYFTFYNKYIILFFLIVYYIIVYIYYKPTIFNSSKITFKSKFNHLFSYEYPILLGFIYIGYILVISTNNLLIVYLGFEIQTFVILIISGQLRTIYTVAITNLKYFFFSFLSSLMFLLSLLYLYNFSYSLNYYEIYLYLLYNWEFNINNLFIYAGLILLLSSFFFKLGVFPFYIWVLDIFEGFPRLITLLLLTLNKFNLYIFLIKFLTIITTFNLFIYSWVLHILTVVSLMSLLLGSLLALTQTNIHRFFGATSITHMGLLLILLKVSLLQTNNSSYYIVYSYFILYMSLTFLFFLILLFWSSFLNLLNNNIKKNNIIKKINFNFNFIKDFSWFNFFSKKTLVVLVLILFNFSGFPPFSFFYVKFNLIWLLTANQLYFESLLILYFSTLITGSYIRIISIVYLENSTNSTKITYLYKYIFQLINNSYNYNFFKLSIVQFEYIIILLSFLLSFYNYFFIFN